MEELRNASIDSGAEAMDVLQDRINVLEKDVSNTTRLHALEEKQEVIIP